MKQESCAIRRISVGAGQAQLAALRGLPGGLQVPGTELAAPLEIIRDEFVQEQVVHANTRRSDEPGSAVVHARGILARTRYAHTANPALSTVVQIKKGSANFCGPSANARQRCTRTSRANSAPVVVT